MEGGDAAPGGGDRRRRRRGLFPLPIQSGERGEVDISGEEWGVGGGSGSHRVGDKGIGGWPVGPVGPAWLTAGPAGPVGRFFSIFC